MKNYTVKALFNFNDLEEDNILRKAGESIWKCTKERYEFLKSKNAVTLLGIEKIETPIESVVNTYTTEIKKKSEKRSKKTNK